MLHAWSGHPALLVALMATVSVVFVVSIVMLTLARFYRRCGADEALVRTGAGGNKVVIGGGITVYPILHELLPVSLRSVKLSVEREGRNALVTRDKIKANVTTELFIKVEPIAEDVLAAARSFGERNLVEDAIRSLIEGKLTDALRSVAANQTFMDLHGKRKEFAEQIQAALTEELKKNGLTLENVSITALAMVPVKDLDPHDVFDAEGLRAITESVQGNAELTNQVQREKENAIKRQNVEARKAALTMEQDQARAEADQTRRVAEYAATQQAETARAVYSQQQARETARIQQEQAIAIAQQGRMLAEREAQIAAEKAQLTAQIAKEKEIEAAMIDKQKTVQAAEIDRQKALEAATVEKQKTVEAAEIAKEQTIETARIAKQISITQSEEQAARASALKALAEAEAQRAAQAILTVEATAQAQREKEIAVIKSEEVAQQSRIAAEGEALKLRVEAEARALAAQQEAAAMITLAEATLRRGQAEAEARRLTVDAENAVSSQLLVRDVTLKFLDVLPEVTRELMTPAKAISEIKVLQLQGVGGAPSAEGSSAPGGLFGAASPVLKTLMEAGAAYPVLREMMQFGQIDPDKLAGQATALLGSLPAELQKIVARDPSLAANVARAADTAATKAPALSVRAADEGPVAVAAR